MPIFWYPIAWQSTNIPSFDFSIFPKILFVGAFDVNYIFLSVDLIHLF